MSEQKVQVTISGDASGLLAALQQAAKGTEGMAKQMETAVGGVASMLEKFAAPIAGFLGVLAGGHFLKEAISETAELGDELSKGAQKAGVTVEALSGLAHAAKLSDVAFEDLVGALAKLAKNMQEAVFTPTSKAAAAFKALGIEVQDANGHLRPTDQVLGDVAEKFASFKDGAGKTAIAMNLFGKSGAQMIPLLNEGKEGIAELTAEAQRLGITMTTEQAEAAERYKDNLERVEAVVTGLKRRIGDELIPTLDELNTTLIEDGPQAVTVLGVAAKGLVTAFKTVGFVIGAVIQTIISLGATAGKAIGGVWTGAQWAIAGQFGKAKDAITEGFHDAHLAMQAGDTVIQKDWENFGVSLNRIWDPNLAGGGKRRKRGTGGAPSVLPDDASGQSGILTKEEIQARLAAIEAGHQQEITLEQKKNAELLQANKEYLEEAAKISKDAAEGRFNGDQAAVEALWQANKDRRKRAEDQANQQYAISRQKMEEDLQAKLASGEEGGLAKRLETVRRQFQAIREENIKLGGKVSESVIISAEDAAKNRARTEQIKEDLAELKRQLAELAQTKGGPLTNGEMTEAMDRFGASSVTASVAVSKLRQELHLDEGAIQGWNAGIREFLANGQNAFLNWKNAALSVMQGVENAFARGFQGILTMQMTLSQGLRSIWQGVTGAIIQMLAQLAAKWVVTAIAAKIFKDSASDAAKDNAVAQQESAASTLWATYSGIPFVGPAIAAAFIAMMNASLVANAAGAKGIVGAAEGGWFDRPTMAMIGEGKRPELVVPDVAFRDFAANLSANILAQERQAQGYGRQAAGYARGAADAGGGAGAMQEVHVHMAGVSVLDSSRRGLQQLGNHVLDALQVVGGQRGQVLVPGRVVTGGM
jgi:TP901 family phage tail tape measure protein